MVIGEDTTPVEALIRDGGVQDVQPVLLRHQVLGGVVGVRVGTNEERGTTVQDLHGTINDIDIIIMILS